MKIQTIIIMVGTTQTIIMFTNIIKTQLTTITINNNSNKEEHGIIINTESEKERERQ